MPPKINFVKVFNDELERFLALILQICPGDAEIVIAQKYIKKLRGANPAMLLSIWESRVVSQYVNRTTEWADRDEIAFFAEKDYGGELSMLSTNSELSAYTDVIASAIERLRVVLRGMNEANHARALASVQLMSRTIVGWRAAGGGI